VDLFVANYIDLDLATAPTPSPACADSRVPVACGPPGLKGGVNLLYHNWATAGSGTSPSDPASRTRTAATLGDHARLRWTDLAVATIRTRARFTATVTAKTFEDVGVKATCAYARTASRGRHGRGRWRLRPQWDDGHPEDELRRGYLDACANLGGYLEDRTFDGGLGLNTRWLG
jgi:hypothetical protein